MMPKVVKFGRFLIRSRMPITCEQRKTLNHRNARAIELVRDRVFRGIWTIVELDLP